MPNEAIAVMNAAGSSAIPNRRCSPIAAPRNSARSVAIAITSACSQSPMVTRCGSSSRQTSARLRPVATPSFAERPCTSIAMMLDATTTHTSV